MNRPLERAAHPIHEVLAEIGKDMPNPNERRFLLIDLLKEAREALFAMKPSAGVRGCFVDGQTDCVCTACKLKRAIVELENQWAIP